MDAVGCARIADPVSGVGFVFPRKSEDSVTSYRPGTVVVLSIGPSISGRLPEHRPAVILFDAGDSEIVVLPATTQGARSEYDIAIAEWHRAGFKEACWVRVNKPQTVDKRLVSKKPGSLVQQDWSKVRAALGQLFSPTGTQREASRARRFTGKPHETHVSHVAQDRGKRGSQGKSA